MRVAAFLARAALLLSTAACASATPAWWNETPAGYRNMYAKGKGSGPTPASARRAAVADGLALLSKRGQLHVELVKEVDTLYVAETLGPRGGGGFQRRFTSTSELVTKGRALTIEGLEVAAEHQSGSWPDYQVDVLLRMPRATGVRRPPGRPTFVTQSLLLPGWGQFAKGDPVTGSRIMWTSAVFGFAAYGAHLFRVDRVSAASGAGEQAQANRWTTQANQARQVEIGATAVSAAAWLYGVYDALSGPVHIWASRGAGGVSLRVPWR